MKADWYMKLVLTVIAVCLAVLVMRDVSLVPEAQAAKGSHPDDNIVKVKIVSIDPLSYMRWEAIPVEVQD